MAVEIGSFLFYKIKIFFIILICCRMPPVSRHQSKKPKPYSNENRSSERRTALSNLNNVNIKIYFCLQNCNI